MEEDEEGLQLPPDGKIPTLSEIIKKLWFICKDHKPQISFCFYFTENGKHHHIALMNKSSIKFKLMLNIIKSRGALVPDVEKYLEIHGDPEPMDIQISHSDNYKKIYEPIRAILSEHCDECRTKWEGMNLFLTEIDGWSDYVREVKFLRDNIEKMSFCVSVREYFPYSDELAEYGHEYQTRLDNIFDMFQFITFAYYFVVEYWDSINSKIEIWKASMGAMPGADYLDGM